MMMTSAAMSAVLKSADEVRAANHLGHGPRDEREVDRSAAHGDQQHHGRDKEVHQRRRRKDRHRLVLALDDVLVLLHVPIDTHRARQQALDLLVDVGQEHLHVPPARHHGAQQLVPLVARLAIGLHRLLVRLHDGFVDVGEHVAAAVLLLELGDRLDGANPAGWVRGDFHGVLVILLDASDRLAQAAMQVRVVGEILADRLADARELALDDALLRFAARCEQHLTVALREPRFGVRHGVRGEPQTACDRATGGANRLMSGMTCEVQDRHQHDGPDDGRNGWPRSDREQNVHRHDWQPRCRRKTPVDRWLCGPCFRKVCS